MILHANWLPDRAVMAFWLEHEPPLPAADRGAAAAAGRYCRHPHALGGDAVLDSLPAALDAFADECPLLLPTVKGRPAIAGAAGALPPAVPLLPWLVETGQVLAENWFEYVFLVGVEAWRDGHDGQPPAVRWGDSPAFWHELARFGRRLYEAQYYAPGVVQLENRIYPAWQAVLNAAAEPHWRRLLQAMPPLCRAVVGHDEPSHDSPARLALSFVDACVDYLARTRLLCRAPRQAGVPKTSTPLHRQWLASLKAGHFQYLAGHAAALPRFAGEVAAWTGYLRPTGHETGWRLALELTAPAVESGPWRVDLGLVSVKHPADRLTAAAVWEDAGARHTQALTREAFLAGLGLAATVFPQLAAALHGPTPPAGCTLTQAEAAAFMLEVAPRLRRLGLVVRLPGWWDERDETLGLRLRVKVGPATPDRQTFLGLNHVVDYHWEIALGDQTLDAAEFQQLARLKQQLVFRQGRWRRLDVDALNQSLALLAAKGASGSGRLSKVLKLTRDVERAGGLRLLDVTLDEPAAAGTTGLLAEQAFQRLPPPAGFHGVLPPYQVHGFSWMVFLRHRHLGGCLADDMGLGKTIQLIAVLLHELEAGILTGPTLIVCPMSVVGNWVKEIYRFAPHLTVLVHHGTDRPGLAEFTALVERHQVVVSTYNLVVRDQLLFQNCRWHNLVLDEAQNIKNPATKQATVIRALVGDHRYCLTGTPIENRLAELWSLMDFLNPGYLGTLGAFRSTFSQPIEREQDQTRARLLQQLIRPFILRRLKSDKDIIRDLPEKHEMKVYCNLTAEQAALYQAVVDHMLERLRDAQGIARKGLVLAALTKLKQIANHPVHFLRDASPFTAERSGKLQRLEDMLETVMDAGERALIFSQFTEIGEALRAKLQVRFGLEVLYLHGGSSKAQRDEMIARFQSPHGPRLFLLSLKAGGLGLNLTAANHVFHFDRWWNPAIEDQATDRTYRIGQTRNVQVHKFICIGTVEEKIDQMIEDKKRLADNIVIAGEAMLTELSTDELRQVFALSRDAVVE